MGGRQGVESGVGLGLTCPSRARAMLTPAPPMAPQVADARGRLVIHMPCGAGHMNGAVGEGRTIPDPSMG
jgi:hypothetical protein